jgi:hypothetical protein
MKFWRQVLRGLPVVALVCGMLPAPVEAQFSQQGPKLVASDAIGNAEQGASVSLSADGNTAIVGGPDDNNLAGAAWVYTRSGGVWSEQAKLIGTDAIGPAFQGVSVSLSADGNTAIVGGSSDNFQGSGNAGAAWVYTRSGGGWSQQAKLVGTGAVGPAAQGVSVSLSVDGNTAIVGGPFDNFQGAGPVGAAWVYTRSGGVWSEQAKLIGTDAIGPAFQGVSVSLSADGNTAIIGGDADNGGIPSGVGAAWVFTRSSGAWTQQAKLVGTGAIGGALQGVSVALSADGNTAIVGGPDDDNGGIPFGGVGAAWVYTRSAGVWTQQQAKLVATDAVGPANQGFSVSLSSDGNTSVVGGRLDSAGGFQVGATWVYTRSGGGWSQQAKLVGTGAVGRAWQGYSASLSANGRTAMVGGLSDDSNGAAWVFAEPVVFAGTPGKANCHGQSVSALAKQYGGLNAAAAALGFPSVQALQDAIMAFCGE